MGLDTWDVTKRLQFVISPTTVSGSATVPFVFKIAPKSGYFQRDLSYIFTSLGGQASVANRKKIIFSQVVYGEEYPLYSELDNWDAVSMIACFWVRPKYLSSTHINIFYMYFEATHVDNTLYLSETNETSLSLFRGLGVEGTNDTTGIFPFDIIKVGAKYQLWSLGYGSSSKWGILYCESTDLTTWTNHVLAFDWSFSYAVDGHHSGTVVYENGLYKMWYSGMSTTKWRILYCESLDGITWTNHRLVIATGAILFSNQHAMCPAVLKEGATYKMWYSVYSNTTTSYVAYCESQNGINWKSHQLVIYYYEIPEKDISIIRPNKVVFKDNKYIMHAEVHNGTYWVGYYMDSVDGTHWENYSRLVSPNTLGVYDTLSAGYGNCHVEVDGLYYIFYGVYSSNWRIALSKSVTLKAFRTPSQEVWGDSFFSVHHFNPSFGYIDSTSNRLNVVSTNEILPVESNLGTSAIELTSSSSYVNFGTSLFYDFSKNTGVHVFGKYFSGNTVLSKGVTGKSAFNLYYLSETVIQKSVDDTFTGINGTYPNTSLWTSNNYLTILDNKLHVELNPSDTTPGKGQSTVTKWYIQGDFDVEVDFESITLDDISQNTKMIHLTAYSVSDSSAYFFIGIGVNSGIKYWTRIQTPGTACCSDTTIVRNFSVGSIRLRRIGTKCYIYYKDAGTSDTWVQARTSTWCDHCTGFYFQSWRSSTSFDVDGYFDNFKVTGTVFWSFNTSNPNSLNLEIYDTVNGMQCTSLKNTTPENLWLSTTMAKLQDLGPNTLLRHSLSTTPDISLNTLNFTTQPLYLGSSTTSILGQVAEVWFSNTAEILTNSTLAFIDKILRDNVVEISNCYVQGYATAYGKAQVTKILAYNKENKLLIGYAETNPENGYYYIEVPNQEECYLIGLDGHLYNHYILGKIFPYVI